MPAQRKDWVKKQQEAWHMQAKKRGLRRNQTFWYLDPELTVSRSVRNKFSLFKPRSLWYFVMASPANKYSVQYLLSLHSVQFSSFQSLSQVWLFATPWTTACQASLSITNSWSPPKSMSIESVMPSSHLIFCRPLLLLPSIFPSIRIFSNESTPCIRWPKYWSFSFNISPFNEHPRLISFRMDWLDLLAVQGTLKSLLQHHSLFSH